MTRKSIKNTSAPPRIPRLLARALTTNRYILADRVKRKKMGRPSVMTQEVVGKLEFAFAFDSTVEEACLYAGISPDTYYTFCKQHSDFSERITALRCAPTLMARMCVIRAAEHDANIALKYLERKLPMEFSTRAQIHHTNDAADRHHVDPKQIALIKQAMGNWVRKRVEMEDKKAAAEIRQPQVSPLHYSLPPHTPQSVQ